MRLIKHLLPVRVRYGLATLGVLLIAGEVAAARQILTTPLFTTIFQSYYLLALGIILLLIGLFASEQALDTLFGDEKHKRNISSNPNPGMGEKKNSVFGENTDTFGNGGGGGGGD